MEGRASVRYLAEIVQSGAFAVQYRFRQAKLIAGRLLADCWPVADRLLADCVPTPRSMNKPSALYNAMQRRNSY
jgi:hypothetical protein